MATTPTPKLFLDVSGKRYPVASAQQASELFSAARDKSGLGASGIPTPRLYDGAGNQIGYVSYNGRVWEGDPMAPTVDMAKLVYDPRVEA